MVILDGIDKARSVSSKSKALPFSLRLESIGKIYKFAAVEEEQDAADNNPLDTTRYDDFVVDVFKTLTRQPATKTMEGQLPGIIQGLECEVCGRCICSTSVALRPLPDKSWTELVDCWSCHQSEFAVVSERLHTSADGMMILPRDGYIFYDSLRLVLNANNYQPCACHKPELQFVEDCIYRLRSEIILKTIEGQQIKPPNLYSSLVEDLQRQWFATPSNWVYITDGTRIMTLEVVIAHCTFIEFTGLLIRCHDSGTKRHNNTGDYLDLRWEEPLFDRFSKLLTQTKAHLVQKYIQKHFRDNQLYLMSLPLVEPL